jgi:hypothetical protein
MRGGDYSELISQLPETGDIIAALSLAPDLVSNLVPRLGLHQNAKGDTRGAALQTSLT